VGLLAPRPTPNLDDHASEFKSPGDRVAELYPQALDFPFIRLLRHAGVWWDYFSPPPHGENYISYHIYSNILYHTLLQIEFWNRLMKNIFVLFRLEDIILLHIFLSTLWHILEVLEHYGL
jgi:hypothetical protein